MLCLELAGAISLGSAAVLAQACLGQASGWLRVGYWDGLALVLGGRWPGGGTLGGHVGGCCVGLG